MFVVDRSSAQDFSKLYIASPFFFDMFVAVYCSEVVGSFLMCHCYGLCFCLSLLIVNYIGVYPEFTDSSKSSRYLVCGII